MTTTRLHLAQRMGHIQPFYVMELLTRARALEHSGRSIIHMEIGEPDLSTPAPIIAAGQQALASGHTHYTPASGLPQLREAISQYYQEQFGVAVEPGRIMITPGASGALQLLCGVLINPSEQVLMADPGYPCNRHFVRFMGGEPVLVAVNEDTGYQLTPELVARHWTKDTVAVLLASPSNPTGTVLSAQQLVGIIEVAQQHGGLVMVDEIYQGLIYEGEQYTALNYSDQVFVINSFSKYFNMTGWRVGWLVAPEAYIDAIDKLAQSIYLAVSTPAQYAALAAFSGHTRAMLDQRRDAFKERRDYLLPALRELGFDIPVVPQGAFYLYAGCQRFSADSYALAMDLLQHAGVAITPGLDFGNNAPEGHVRFAYTTNLDNLKEGVRRMKEFLK